ncbi:MAG: pyruvate kinase [Candidatus Omnitrophica bacterium]|nr:pyruvate kinase [Candidatus Omnitrophota bacterium]
MVKTKIIATLGPATDNKTILRKMIFAGLDAVRLNFSHSNLELHTNRLIMVRELNKTYSRSIKIIQDLEGYRIRIGVLKKEFLLKKGDVVYFTQEEPLRSNEVYFDYKGSLKGIPKNSLIYVDDGKIILKTKEIEKKRLKLEVILGGILKSKKGINIPEAKLEFEPITKKDIDDVKFAILHKVEYVAQSFVSKASDIRRLSNLIKPQHPNCKIIAKIENKEAIKNIDEIIDASDAIMIARGDMGICLPIHKVPIIQKEIIKLCKVAEKPVIVATQMLESMTEELIPTRAEVSDVANAILDGADFVMLSSETAVGKYPHKVVEMMNNIIKATENYKKGLKNLLL